MSNVSHHAHQTNVHSGYSPGSVIATAVNFSVAGQPIARVGDVITPHTRPNSPPHIGATIAAGAAHFTVGSKPAARIGDPTTCGAKLAQGVASFRIG